MKPIINDRSATIGVHTDQLASSVFRVLIVVTRSSEQATRNISDAVIESKFNAIEVIN